MHQGQILGNCLLVLCLSFEEGKYVFIRNALSANIHHKDNQLKHLSLIFKPQVKVFLILSTKITYKNISFYLRYLNVMIPEVLR